MASSDVTSRPPLDGIRVLSFGAFVAGNICALLLAELGADVVKIESRDRPEALRAYDTPGQPELFEPSGVRTTALFAGMARSMRSVSIDMSEPAGRDVFRDLVRQTHVVIENLGPGTMEAWGCSFSALRECNPTLVMLSISGYGRSGPLAGFRAYASNINNYLGLTTAWASDGTHFDFVAGVHGACAVVAGLTQVDHGAGDGVFIDLAQTEAGAALMAPLYLDFLANGHEQTAAPNEVPGSLLSLVARCAGSDAWVALDLEDARDWETICDYLDRHDLRLANRPHGARGALRTAIEAWASELTPWQAALHLQALGLAAAPVQDSEDLWRDPQLRSRDCYADVWQPEVGRLEYPKVPGRLSRTPGHVKSRAPRLGEHTRTVLAEWLRRDEGSVRALESNGAVWQAGSA